MSFYHGSHLSSQEIQKLCDRIRTDASMTTLSIPNTGLTDETVRPLLEALRGNTSVCSVDLRSNSFTPSIFPDLLAMLETNTAILRLDLPEVDVAKKQHSLLKRYLLRNQLIQTKDHSFELSKRTFSKDCLACLCEGIRANPIITELVIFRNKLKEEAEEMIAQLLLDVPRLKNVTISQNNFVCSNGFMTSALRQNSTLVELNLMYNDIDDDGAECLARALKSNTGLEMLDLSSNCIGSIGACAIADMVKYNTRLTFLNLSANDIEDEGGTALAEALLYNRALKNVCVTENELSEDVEDLIGERADASVKRRLSALRYRPSLHTPWDTDGVVPDAIVPMMRGVVLVMLACTHTNPGFPLEMIFDILENLSAWDFQKV